ncbi:class I tRNA ligase family protein [Mycoplasma sp. 744]|uniref:class I tRNA ligase family protein n=1 Tax=Mycoplasma sp. 744 TaxID=3108531 RepID=UPI002B1D935D|nr:class I tRNA ligase family protein [Mycoplasma sp. 744]MEA4115583.1 class I tRNA ligase family protein [Mycoplasma sp. 744]
MNYDVKLIEKKWQNFWLKNKLFEPKNDFNLPKKYILSMFPYPSGNIHMGHVRNYVLGDVFARFYRKNGFNVLHPFGWDAFGLPAENAAIKNNIHPKEWTYQNINKMNESIKKLGISFTWSRQIITADEDYTKFDQLIFVKMWEKGLIYRKETFLNWCEKDKTVLANEQVENGKCWRCDEPVIQKLMPQYYVKITKYAKELQDSLSELKNYWPEKVLLMQKNWINYNEGYETNFVVNNHNLNVFFNNYQELINADFLAISSKNKLIKKLFDDNVLNQEDLEKINVITNNAKAKKFDKKLLFKLPCSAKSKNFSLPIYITDFASALTDENILIINIDENKTYKEFAIKNNIKKNNTKNKLFDIDYIKSNKANLKDWGISRQRYWGAPIPIVHCKDCGIVPEKISNLPVKLPEKVKFNGEGNPILTNSDWLKTFCPKCNKIAQRESDTFDTFWQSSWYFARYTTALSKRNNVIFDEEVNYWKNVDQYIGGVEHAILHLLYSRFFTKVLADLKLLNYREPFNKLLTQGMVLKDGFKMSKSKGNTVSPEEMINKYSADAVRLFILFAAPPEKDLEWSDTGIEGCQRFINRIIQKSYEILDNKFDYKNYLETFDFSKLNSIEKKARKKMYELVEKFNNIFISNNNSFNTIIALCMEILNDFNNINNLELNNEFFYIILNILEPFMPHLAWELSDKFFGLKNLSKISLDPRALLNEEIIYPITVNGKFKNQIIVPVEKNNQEYVLTEAKKIIKSILENKKIIKEIFIINKIVNFVIK